jgi:hypothetical protein
MFDRLDTNARRVLELAQQEALEFGHHHLGTEHLLIALARTDDTSGLLASLGCWPDTARALAVAIIGRDLPPRREPETLLAAVGIDLGEVRRRVETTFGSEAMIRASQRIQPRRRWRHRLPWPGCDLNPTRSALLGEPWRGMARVKKVMEMATREAAPGPATPAHLLWAIAEEGEGVACQILTKSGIDLAGLAKSARTRFA